MKKIILILILAISMQSCGQEKYKYSDKETKQFLEEITKNTKSEISFITQNEKQPTDNFLIVTKYPVPKEKLKEYEKNGHIKNTFDDLSDFTTYNFKKYELINEKNKKMSIVDNGRAIYLQKFALWKHNNILYNNVGIDITLNQEFEKLNGYINIEFEMPNGMKEQTKIPI